MGRAPTVRPGTGRLSVAVCPCRAPLPAARSRDQIPNQNRSIGGEVKARTTGAIRVVRVVRVAAIAACSAVSVGCYRYTPIDAEAPPALGTEVRVRLTDAGAVALAPLVGNRVELVDGRLVSAADTAVTLSVSTTTDRLGNEAPWRGEEVAIPRAMFTGLEKRTLDRGKSYLVGGITAGVVAAVGIGFSVAGGGGGGKATGPGVPK